MDRRSEAAERRGHGHLLLGRARPGVLRAPHGNIDRLWYIRRGLLFPGNADFTDPDWLDASFLFYDEDARLVRVRVRDSLDAATLRFTYQDVGLPWLNAKPSGGAAGTLDKIVRVAVTRPKMSRSRKEKDAEEEVLVIEGIEVPDHSTYVKFDVFVNAPESGDIAAATSAGSVALTPHGVLHEERMRSSRKTVARFGIGDLLDDIGADGDKTIVVSIVPRSGCDSVTVAAGVSIGYAK
uniref:Polyphenol oxidase C-terminal domain-containing protein n=1 Tax=Oryza punctata TaxID=4537 RepID=A0A0E0KVG8_ORYPU